MKEALFLIVIKIMMTFNISEMKPNLSSQIVDFKCSYKGKEQDIKHFLGTDDIEDAKNFSLMRFANIYTFSTKGGKVKGFMPDIEYREFETEHMTPISVRSERDRIYKLESMISDERLVKILLKRTRNKYYTRLKGKTLYIDCTKIKKR